MRASSGLPEELPKKLGRTEVFVSSNWQPWCPSAGTISNIDVGSYRGCRRHPNCAYPRASGPGALADGPINRSIEEERRVQVLVRDNNVDQALKVLKKKMQREGIFREMKLRGHYEKPSERRVREKAEAIRRARKLARKKLQREGLLPMKPRVIPGVPGRGGPTRAPRF
jgi:small subunit ribosomal protein S21